MIIKSYEKVNKEEYSEFVLGGDIGGTKTRLGIAGVKKKKPVLLFSAEINTREIKSFPLFVNEVLEYAKEKYNISPKRACFGVAGPVPEKRNRCKLTNLKLNVNVKRILKKTSLGSLFLINDFEAIGYGVNLLSRKDIIKMKPGKKITGATKAVIGAGTGLGKCILVFNREYDIYLPVTSEGGHVDFPVKDKNELELMEFIKKFRNLAGYVSYEDVLSGNGIEALYYFFKKSFKKDKHISEIEKSEDIPAAVSKYRKRSGLCREVFRLYAKFYGRCAKNFVLETLARGGLYIAGGIAQKNTDIFRSQEFLKEFETSETHRKILKAVPVYIITDENIGLKGACFSAYKIAI